MKIVGLIVLVLSLSLSQAWAQAKKPASIAELAPYLGADREQVLYAGAKSEGKISWYTSLAGGSYKALADGFEKKYRVSRSNPSAPPAATSRSSWRRKPKRAVT